MIHNQSGATLPGHKSPKPLHKNAHPKIVFREELEMDRRPGEPRHEATNSDCAALKNREALPDHSHATFVEVTKRTQTVLAGNPPANQVANITSLLHRHLSDARQRFAILIERRCIADHEDFGITWNSRLSLDSESPRTVGLGIQPLPGW